MVTTTKDSHVNGSINTIYADISGVVSRDLEAKQKVSLSSTARLKGNLLATILVIEEGASFNGLCKMVSKNNNKSASSNKKVANLNEGSKN